MNKMTMLSCRHLWILWKDSDSSLIKMTISSYRHQSMPAFGAFGSATIEKIAVLKTNSISLNFFSLGSTQLYLVHMSFSWWNTFSFCLIIFHVLDCVMKPPLLLLRSRVALSFKVFLWICEGSVTPDQISTCFFIILRHAGPILAMFRQE